MTGRWKGHFGTDFAAPIGTPIYSTADGTVVEASYTRYNGYYVKIKHNSTYTTQYLHMDKSSKRLWNKSKIKKGKKVSQGVDILDMWVNQAKQRDLMFVIDFGKTVNKLTRLRQSYPHQNR